MGRQVKEGEYLLAERERPANHPNSHHARRRKTSAFESLDYDFAENRPYRQHWLNLSKRALTRLRLQQWGITFFTGLLTGTSAFVISKAVHLIAEQKFSLTRSYLHDGHVWSAFAIFAVVCVACVGVSAALVTLVEPAAGGSGIPEIKAYLNGVNVPCILRMKTLFVKFVGVIFSVSGGLFIGKEGPMVHTGSIIAAGISQGGSPTIGCDAHVLEAFRNDHDKRNFVSAGAAAGVAAAFGAPIGGILFSLEEASSFWNVELTWRTFFCSMVSTFSLNFFLSGAGGYFETAGLITYGVSQGSGYHLVELIPFMMLGVVGGLLGAAFNLLNIKITELRLRHVTPHKPRRIVEACLVALVTATATFGLPFLFGCIDDDTPQGSSANYVRFTCEKGKYNPMATLIFTTQEDAIKHLFSRDLGDEYTLASLGVYCIAVFWLAVVTYGTAVPSGLFVPSILIGSSFGRFFGRILELIFTSQASAISPGVYALIGASSMLGGCARMTISLTVIVFEITNDITYLLPIMLSIMVAKTVGDQFTEPLYDAHVRLKCIPFLEPSLEGAEELRAMDVMHRPVVSVPPSFTARFIVNLLRAHPHQGFPVVTPDGNILGLVLRSQLRVMLRLKMFKSDDASELPHHEATLFDFYRGVRQRENEQADLQSVEANELDMVMDVAQYLNPYPYEVVLTCPVPRLYRLFRTMGLRHLLVVDSNRSLCGIVTRKDLTEEALHSRHDHDSLVFESVLPSAPVPLRAPSPVLRAAPASHVSDNLFLGSPGAHKGRGAAAAAAAPDDDERKAERVRALKAQLQSCARELELRGVGWKEVLGEEEEEEEEGRSQADSGGEGNED